MVGVGRGLNVDPSQPLTLAVCRMGGDSDRRLVDCGVQVDRDVEQHTPWSMTQNAHVDETASAVVREG